MKATVCVCTIIYQLTNKALDCVSPKPYTEVKHPNKLFSSGCKFDQTPKMNQL